jgi:hypothetical protein
MRQPVAPPEVTPCLIPIKYLAWHASTMPDLASHSNKKAPEIRGFRHFDSLGLPGTAVLEITSLDDQWIS